MNSDVILIIICKLWVNYINIETNTNLKLTESSFKDHYVKQTIVGTSHRLKSINKKVLNGNMYVM
jgi:hypothetical protein